MNNVMNEQPFSKQKRHMFYVNVQFQNEILRHLKWESFAGVIIVHRYIIES